jgi:hypothetical protein
MTRNGWMAGRRWWWWCIGTSEFLSSLKKVFPPEKLKEKNKRDSFLPCIKFTRIMVITLLTLYLFTPHNITDSKRKVVVVMVGGTVLAVSWAYKGKTLSDGGEVY